MLDLDDNRLEMAKRFGATAAINSADGKAVETVMKMTGRRGVDTAIEAVGIPATFELCEKIVAPGGTIANMGCMERRWRSIWSAVGPQHHHHHTAGRYRQHADAAQHSAVPQDRPQASDYASLQANQHPRCLRDIRACRQNPSTQGDYRGLRLKHDDVIPTRRAGFRQCPVFATDLRWDRIYVICGRSRRSSKASDQTKAGPDKVNQNSPVMPALVAGVTPFFSTGKFGKQCVDGRDKPGGDSEKVTANDRDMP